MRAVKKKYKILLGVALFALLSVGAFALYVSDYYHADVAVETMALHNQIHTEGNLMILSPSTSSDTAIVFYPGAKVEEIAYLPLLEQLSQSGITCVLVKMPYRLAFFDSAAAGQAFDNLPDIECWYLAGHSLGGAMASSYTAKNPNSVSGLILLGAYVYGDVPEGKSLTIYGSEDTILDTSKVTQSEGVLVIEGGNHAYFGNYGEQDGDGEASITREEQQTQTVEAILDFIDSTS
jgi:hypothetical protein